MKRYITICLAGLFALLFAFPAAAQKPTCDSHSYSTEVLKEAQVSENCVEYEIKVSYDGTRSFGLSHYSIGIPCGEIKDVSNSENWKQVFGKDPTTGVYGLKIDDISGFGEGGADSFTIKFTWCADNSCNQELGVVSYKAGRCVDYDTLSNDSDPDPGNEGQTCSTLLASLQKKDVTCSAGNDGQMQVIIQEGQEPFVYSWSTGETTAAVQSLFEGVYAVTVVDANGNTLTLTETITAPSPIVITETVSNPSCSGVANGSIELAVAGGSGGYSFTWSNGSAQQNQTNLAGGLYTVTVIDLAGCSVQKTFMLTNSSLLTATATLTNTSCAQPTGSINLTPSGGIAPYTFLWNNGAKTEDLQNVGAGTYNVMITDAVGCYTFKSYTLRISNGLLVTYNVKPTSCLGDDSGAVDLTVYGGTAPYSFQWLDGPTTEDRTGLTTGTYKVTVSDAGGCSTQVTISISKEPLKVSSQLNQPSCAGDLGSISVTPIGVAPYTYTWSNGETDDTIDGLTNGTYSVTITDASGCSRTLFFAILTPTAIEVVSDVSNTTCGSEGTYSINLSVAGGKSPYTYSWSNGLTTQNVAGLNAGTYSVQISDANGCVITKEFILDPVANGWTCLIDQPSTTSVICGSVGNRLSTAVEGASNYLWTVASTDNSWSITSGSDQASVVYTAGAAGSSATFTLTITKNGCTQTCTYVTSGNCVERDNNGGGDPTSSDPCANSALPVVETDVQEAPTASADSPVVEVTPTIEFKLDVYPNPFKEKLNFEWIAPADDYAKIEILDKFGNILTVVFEGSVTAGKVYNFDWSATGLKDHFYYYRYTSSRISDYGKLLRK